jgi:oligopeptide/dipeptide ABC transporter ATP-binding protein
VIHAVDGVSLDLDASRTLALVGETGCGKTTTAKVVLRLETPTSGAVYFAGKDVHSLRRKDLRWYRSRVQAVFQDPWASLNPRMRVIDIVSEPLIVNAKMSSAERRHRVEEVLAEVGLEPAMAANYPHQFSGGQRQRIAVARALAPASQLIVLDEPVSGLDVSIRAQVMNLLKDLQETHGIAYLLISHNLATVRYLSHRVAVMYLGQIVEEADADDLFTRPLHPYTLALISASTALAETPSDSIVLGGDVPSPARPPQGCRFHTRCWLRERLGNPERCTLEVPALRPVDARHRSACHFLEQIPAKEHDLASTSPTLPPVGYAS